MFYKSCMLASGLLFPLVSQAAITINGQDINKIGKPGCLIELSTQKVENFVLSFDGKDLQLETVSFNSEITKVLENAKARPLSHGSEKGIVFNSDISMNAKGNAYKAEECIRLRSGC